MILNTPFLPTLLTFLTVPITRFACYRITELITKRRRRGTGRRAILGSVLFVPLAIFAVGFFYFVLFLFHMPLQVFGSIGSWASLILSGLIVLVGMSLPLSSSPWPEWRENHDRMLLEETFVNFATFAHLLMGTILGSMLEARI